MSFVRYFANGLGFTIAFIIGFNSPYWLGFSSLHIAFVGG